MKLTKPFLSTPITHLFLLHVLYMTHLITYSDALSGVCNDLSCCFQCCEKLGQEQQAFFTQSEHNYKKEFGNDFGAADSSVQVFISEVEREREVTEVVGQKLETGACNFGCRARNVGDCFFTPSTAVFDRKSELGSVDSCLLGLQFHVDGEMSSDTGRAGEEALRGLSRTLCCQRESSGGVEGVLSFGESASGCGGGLDELEERVVDEMPTLRGAAAESRLLSRLEPKRILTASSVGVLVSNQVFLVVSLVSAALVLSVAALFCGICPGGKSKKRQNKNPQVTVRFGGDSIPAVNQELSKKEKKKNKKGKRRVKKKTNRSTMTKSMSKFFSRNKMIVNDVEADVDLEAPLPPLDLNEFDEMAFENDIEEASAYTDKIKTLRTNKKKTMKRSRTLTSEISGPVEFGQEVSVDGDDEEEDTRMMDFSEDDTKRLSKNLQDALEKLSDMSHSSQLEQSVVMLRPNQVQHGSPVQIMKEDERERKRSTKRKKRVRTRRVKVDHDHSKRHMHRKRSTRHTRRKQPEVYDEEPEVSEEMLRHLKDTKNDDKSRASLPLSNHEKSKGTLKDTSLSVSERERLARPENKYITAISGRERPASIFRPSTQYLVKSGMEQKISKSPSEKKKMTMSEIDGDL